MAHLDRDGPVFQVGQGAVESLQSSPGAMERLGELQQQGPESSGVEQRSQAGEREHGRLFRARPGLVGHRAVGLGREPKIRKVRGTAEPRLGNVRRDRAVEAGVDLDRVDVASHEGESVESSSGRRGVHDALPVRVVPPRHAAANHSAFPAGVDS